MNTKDIEIVAYNYNLPDERIAKYPLPVRDQSKLLVYREATVSEDRFTSLASYIPEGSLMVFNNTKVIQARFYFRKETGALIEVFCLEPCVPNDYVLSFQQTGRCSWLCMVGNLKKWKEGVLTTQGEIKGKPMTLCASRKGCIGTSHEVTFEWDNTDVTFAEILDAFGELPIPPYLNRDTQEKDKETYQTVYSKIKGSVAAPTAGLHFTERVFDDLRKKQVECEELTLHVGAGTFKPVKSEVLAGHEMHTEYISVKRSTIDKLLQHNCEATAVGTTSVRTLESLYYLGLLVIEQPDIEESRLHVAQWMPYETDGKVSTREALQALASYMDNQQLDVLHASTQIIIAPGYRYRIVCRMLTNFHQPQSTLLLLVSAFVDGHWREIYEYALAHDFRFLSYGDSSLLCRGTHSSLQVRKGQPTDYPQIMSVWESSVLATHHFLQREDFEYYKRLAPTAFLPAVDLYVLQSGEELIGFIGVLNKHLEMLFVEADSIGKGYGKLLLSYAVEHLGVTSLDVNEQNEKALAFYMKAGFKIVGRSEKDGSGKDYPILHLSIK